MILSVTQYNKITSIKNSYLDSQQPSKRDKE